MRIEITNNLERRPTGRIARDTLTKGGERSVLAENIGKKSVNYRLVDASPGEVEEKFKNAAEDAFKDGAVTFVVEDSLVGGLTFQKALAILKEIPAAAGKKLEWDAEGERNKIFDISSGKLIAEKD